MRVEARMQEIVPQRSLPLVDRWVHDVRPVTAMREDVGRLLDINNTNALEAYGFPRYLHAIMRLWKEKAPDVLTSFSHPEELDIYKVVALLHLRQFEKQAAEQGVRLPRVLINYYDTVPLHKSALKPLQVGTIGVVNDVLGISGKNKNSTALMTGKEIVEVQLRAQGDAQAISSSLSQLLQEDLILVQREEVTDPQQILPRKVLVERARSIIEARMGVVATALSAAVPIGTRQERGSMKVSRVLMQFEQQLTQRILGLDQTAEETFGYESALSSENGAFLGLIRETIALLVEARGIQVLKDVIAVGEGLAVSDTVHDKQILSKNADEQFVLRTRSGEEQVITDDQALTFTLTHIPLGKLEALALVAGGYTFHMGSEYGIRPKLVDLLEVEGKAAEMVQGLRIGKDKEHGTDGILLQGTSSYMPLMLAYVLLGEEGVIEILRYSLANNTPLEMDAKSLKKLAAAGLVAEVRKESI